ncbi:MAG: Tim44/TimA family putative adaptor protein [Hyphomicrobium sp.]
MDGKIDLLTLISLIVAVVLVLKLRSVLGRRTDDDSQRIERTRAEQQRQAKAGGAPAGSDKVVTLQRRDREEQAGAAQGQPGATVAEAEERIRTFASDPLVTKGLLDILKLDPSFNPEHFVGGAKAAYEMIVTAFAEGNRKALKSLLNRDVFEGFSSAIVDRESRGEIIDQSFVGINKADLLEAEVKSGIASVTVRFVSQLISASRDRSGTVISGDPQKIKEVTDIWTFSRDVSTSRTRQDPNWRLVATQASN